MPTNCLSIHAKYACRHAGACCRTWTIPVDRRVIQIVEDGNIVPSGAYDALFVRSGNSDGTWQIARRGDGRCAFLLPGSPGLCAIHHAAGAGALPAACRHFPRKILRDGRGTFISLSHFCPTAASMLLASVPLAVVDAEPPLRLEEPIEGLDASEALPPLVKPGLLSDLDGYDAWERAAVATFARQDLTCRQALSVIASATEATRAWSPGTGSLSAHVESAFRAARTACEADADARAAGTAAALTADRLPEFAAGTRAPQRPQEMQGWPALERHDAALKNYLAARVFANWMAYQGRGLRSIVEWLRTCAALVALHLSRPEASGSSADGARFIHAVRMADHLMLHVVDAAALAGRFAILEGPDPR